MTGAPAISGRDLRALPDPARRHRPRVPGRRAHRPVRAERLGQDHPALDRRRADRAHDAAARRTTAGRCGWAPATRVPRWPSSSRSTAWCRSCPRARTSPSRCAPGASGPPRPTSAPRPRSPGSTSPTSATARSRSSPAARCSAWPCARGLCVGSERAARRRAHQRARRGQPRAGPRRAAREAERGAVVVVATHDPAVVDACDRHYVLDEGRLVDHVAPKVDLGKCATRKPV